MSAPLRPRTILNEIIDGFAFVMRIPILRAVVIFIFVSNLGGGIQTVVLYALSVEQGFSAATIGLVFSVVGLMSISGSVGAPRMAANRRLGRAMIATQVVGGIMELAMGAFRDVLAMLVAFAFRSTAGAAWQVYIYAARRREVPPQLQGRANGAMRTILLGGASVSPVILSGIQGAFGTGAAFYAAGIASLAGAFLGMRGLLATYDVRPPVKVATIESAIEGEQTKPQA